jgi:uroporphyrinogen III methyltransferase/synthase
VLTGGRLTGRRVLVTRPREQGAALDAALAARGAEPVAFPTIEIRPAGDLAPLDRALAALDDYAWIAFTSANSVDAFFDRLADRRGALPAAARIAAVGPGTARALAARGARVDFMPSEFLGERLGQELDGIAGRRVLFPRAAGAREALARELTRRGAAVDDVVVYETLPATPDPRALAELERGVDAATFTSASTVDNFFLLLDGRAAPLLAGAVIACIGPVTGDAARARGLAVDVEPAEHTVPGLVAALDRWFA